MGVDHPGNARQEFERIWTAIRRLSSQSVLTSASVGRGGIRVYDGGVITIENGGAKVLGWIDVDGEIRIAGVLRGDGEIIWTGDAGFSGDTTIGGTLDVTGATTLRALVTLLNDLRVQGAGKITVTGGDSPLTLENGSVSFGTGGRLAADTAFGGIRMDAAGGRVVYVGTGAVSMQYNLSNYIIVTSSGTTVNGLLHASGGLTTTGSKNFVQPHPSKPEVQLMHGSTESPVSGTEYWGEGELDEAGEAMVELPDYFEGLNKQRNRLAMVTPIGRPFLVGAERIEDGAFKVYGDPGRAFAWLVKAERFGGDFPVESPAVQRPA